MKGKMPATHGRAIFQPGLNLEMRIPKCGLFDVRTWIPNRERGPKMNDCLCY